MAEATIPIHALRKGDRFKDEAGTVVTQNPWTGSELPQGYVRVGLQPGGESQFFGDVQITIERPDKSPWSSEPPYGRKT